LTIDPGGAIITRDEVLITWAPPFPGDTDRECQLRFERSSALTHPDAEHGWSDTVGFVLTYPTNDATRAAGGWSIFRAPAASSPDGRLGPAYDPGRPYVDLSSAHEIEPRMLTAGFSALLDERADRIKGPCPR
jgi:hypothetical protein